MTKEQIPKEVRNKITAKAQVRYGDKYTYQHHEQACYTEGAEYGYSLKQSDLEKTIEEQRKEIERLKGLIESAHTKGWLDFPEEFGPPKTIEQSWQDFATKNNIQ